MQEIRKCFQVFLKEIARLILNHLDTFLTNLKKYFPCKSADQCDGVKSPFVEFEPSEKQFTFTEEKQLASVLSDRTLKSKHS